MNNKIFKKIGETNVMKVIGVVALIIFIALIIYMKFLGAYLETNVEKGGYCHLKYGEGWRFTIKEEKYICIKTGQEQIEFTEKDFKNYCPKEKLISLHFFNKCFRSAPKNINYIDIKR